MREFRFFLGVLGTLELVLVVEVSSLNSSSSPRSESVAVEVSREIPSSEPHDRDCSAMSTLDGVPARSTRLMTLFR